MTAIPTGRFVWFDYQSADVSKAQGFFGELFNWGVKEVPMPGGAYTMIAAGERTIGGYGPQTGGPASWLSHLLVTSAADTAAEIAARGGKVVKQPFKVGEFGQMAVVTDPHGAAFSLWQPAKAEEPTAPAAGSFVWNELASVDPDASVAFYRAIGGFGHEAKDMGPMGTYHVLTSGGAPRAGIMKQAMPGQPHAWLPYVGVPGADATADKAKRLGATIVVPPADIPGVGRFAIFVDPQGAALGILQAAR